MQYLLCFKNLSDFLELQYVLVKFVHFLSFKTRVIIVY